MPNPGNRIQTKDMDQYIPHLVRSLTLSSLSEPLYTNPQTSSRSRRTVSHDSHQIRTSSIHNTPSPALELRNWRDLLPLPLLRRMTSTSSTTPGSGVGGGTITTNTVEVFYCEICLENHPVTEAIQLRGCQCRFCHSSLQQFYETQIRDSFIEFFCPTCHLSVTPQEIQNLVSLEMYSKYLRFVEMKSNPSYRECPKCGHATIGSIDHLNMTCSQCSESFCFIHSNAHPGSTCQQYMRAQRKIESQNRAAINRMSRKCPSCGCDTEKSGGCNHMTCRACGEMSDPSSVLSRCHFFWQSWCWLCGRNITGITTHYDTVTGCPGGQFADAPEWALWTIFPCLRSTCLQYLTRIPYFVFLALFLPCLLLIAIFSFLVSIPSLFLCFPCVYCRSNDDKSCCGLLYDSFLYVIAITVTGLIFAVLYLFQLIWLPLALLLSLVLYPSHLLSRRGQQGENQGQETRRFFTFIDHHRPSYTNTFWCFPLSCFEYFSGSSLKDFFMVMYLKIEERSFSTGI